MSTTSAITSNSSYAGSTSGESRIPMQTLDQDDFLKLLIVQLTQQDPLSPIQDTEFISQMAQFSTLEQSKAMENNIASLRNELQLTQANALIGRSVQLLSGAGLVAGTVSGVELASGTPKIVVNGQSYALSSLLSVATAPTQQGVTP
jgi:flagellar basal-body rod modification protein FlgD